MLAVMRFARANVVINGALQRVRCSYPLADIIETGLVPMPDEINSQA